MSTEREQGPERPWTAEHIISQYVFSAYLLGAKFGGKPTVAYVKDTARTVVADLRAHGFEVAIAQLMYVAQQRWQGMAEDLWEELQLWHADDCPSGDSPDADCTCHRILSVKWDEITHAREYAAEVES